jgi:hypothetical protein
MKAHLSWVFLVLFALLQGLLPLLHAHLGPVAPSHGGVHFHALPIAAEAPRMASSLTIASVPESPAVTAPTEHRRDHYWAQVVWPPAQNLTSAAASASPAVWTEARRVVRAALHPHSLPPPTAPPATC